MVTSRTGTPDGVGSAHGRRSPVEYTISAPAKAANQKSGIWTHRCPHSTCANDILTVVIKKSKSGAGDIKVHVPNIIMTSS
ncbi:MAG: hypothetical protein GFH27_549323n89 [Chloroflexi bacterium AL-W]|nr:hypothetical protein [Chloroflexi bacterium AL-N1]NOK70240.1 hypothetical protein [Chloroflexi bacterium AL-N10]NOK77777.1 hypothetical protein [Chloroflexi bacterium AL-N5]NOK84786.1 hypothetical protein [Chloroflexi bacterium AL-W]NOK92393.1 hypothetical protein [Chloroflexi bacterium AL-N15]